MKPPNRCGDGRARIFNNALQSIKLPQATSRKASIICEENLAQVNVKPVTHLPLTQENMFMHNILSSFENPYRMGVNENEYRFITSNGDECSLPLPNNQSDPSSWVETNHLVLIQHTLHMDAKNELDLWIKESQLWSLQQQEKDSSDQVIDECNPRLPNNQSDVGSWVENDRLASIQETLQMDVNNESDLWIKENRLRALQQLGKDSSDQVINECSPPLQNYQSDLYSWVENNHLVLIQQALHTNTKNELDLSIKENQLWSLQQQGKDSSDPVVGKYSPLMLTNPLDMCSWVENDRLASIQETMLMNVNSESDLWIKENRLRALQQVGKDSLEQYSSNACVASPYSMESSGEISPDMMHNPSAYQLVNVLPHSSGNSISSYDEKFSKSKAASNRKDKFKENEKLFLCEELKVQSAQRNNFSNTCNRSLPKNSRFLDKQKDTANERTETVCENTNEFANLSWCEMFLVKEEIQLSDEFLKVPEPESSGRNKIENTDCDLLQESCKKQMFKDKNNITKLPSYDVRALMTLKSTTGFFDSHCHLDFLLNRQGFYGTYADYMAQHKDSYPESYKGCIAVFCKPLTFAKKFVWQKHLEQDNVWAAFGCHPKEAQDYNDHIEEDLKAALNHHKVKALGEIGLDYSKGNTCPRDVQQSVFRRQLNIAKEKRLRLVIHCRDADDDTINIMLEILPKDIIFHLHCFTGDWKIAQRWIGKFPNVFIGITNVVTYPSATSTHEVARRLPLERLLLETDAPYFVPKMAPEGTYYSHPGMAIHVAAQVAALQNIPVDKVLQWTSSNTKLMYDIQ